MSIALSYRRAAGEGYGELPERPFGRHRDSRNGGVRSRHAGQCDEHDPDLIGVCVGSAPGASMAPDAALIESAINHGASSPIELETRRKQSG
ncbi:hypothetical protein [Burkholderia sp. D-99]|uniref:hypothetical protein n=1 Tax=Burkholderia sp. D-99 TaxID=2717316 RepID=UPI0014219CEC|nr:hypothetical protein [Burkholderia sp. D-99]NHV28681.1 hypothetical protein [Burkholderia sp. D-99]